MPNPLVLSATNDIQRTLKALIVREKCTPNQGFQKNCLKFCPVALSRMVRRLRGDGSFAPPASSSPEHSDDSNMIIWVLRITS